jgi:L-Ala-D/L-Glu epimerase
LILKFESVRYHDPTNFKIRTLARVMASISFSVEHWPIAGTFAIARGAKTEAVIVLVTISNGVCNGRGEAVPYARYGETPESVCAQIAGVKNQLEQNPERMLLSQLLPAGAARNALDCALWDLDAKTSGIPVWKLTGVKKPKPVETAYTISLATPDIMFEKALAAAHRPILKIKLGTADDMARLDAVRAGAPAAKIIVDANEGWTIHDLDRIMPQLLNNGVTLIEQPLPADADTLLAGYTSAIPLCADESAHVTDDVARLANRYQFINIKLDKCGGLTEALLMAKSVQAAGLGTMIGCMVGTSLAMAPAMLLTSDAAYVDLDGPLLLAKDRANGLNYEGSLVHPPASDLWG